MLSPQERWTLGNLIGQEIAGQAAPAEQEQLESLLLASAEARAYYYRSIAVHVELFWNGGAPSGETQAGFAADDTSPPSQRTLVHADGPARRSGPRGKTGARHLRQWAARLSPRLLAGSAIVLLVGYFVAAAAYVMLRTAPRPVAKSSVIGEPAADFAAATLVASENAQWQTDTPAPTNPQLEISNQKLEVPSHHPLQLAAGIVELKLQKGVTLRVEAPAEWTIDGPNRATLQRGKLLASVPHEAIGFTVVTPTARVVDLGTEFGVTVDERGGAHTRVFRGEVKLRATSPDSGPPNGAAAIAPPAWRLTAGQAVSIDAAGNIAPVDFKFATAEDFIRPPGTPPRTADAPHPYSRAVLATKGLVGYWRLSEAGPGDARDEVPALGSDEERAAFARQRNERIRPAAAGCSPGDYREFWMADFRRPGALSDEKNYAVHFNGESYVEVDDHPGLSGDWDGLTLAAWIKPDRNPPAGSDATALIVGKWAFETSGDAYVLLYERPGTIRLAVGNGKQDENGLRGTGTVPITADAYHFVAGTWNKATGAYRLYVDGRADAAQGKQQAPWQTNPKSYVPVFIGGQRTTNNRYFAGAIDEVSIFNRTLTAEEIKNLYEQATVAEGRKPSGDEQPATSRR